MTSRIMRMKVTVITFECSGCGNTHPDDKSAIICCKGVILPPINKELDDLVGKLIDDTYKDMPVTPLYRSKDYG